METAWPQKVSICSLVILLFNNRTYFAQYESLLLELEFYMCESEYKIFQDATCQS